MYKYWLSDIISNSFYKKSGLDDVRVTTVQCLFTHTYTASSGNVTYALAVI